MVRVPVRTQVLAFALSTRVLGRTGRLMVTVVLTSSAHPRTEPLTAVGAETDLQWLRTCTKSSNLSVAKVTLN